MFIPHLENFNLEEYFSANSEDWGPRPVRVIWESSDYVTLLVRGPSRGKEFHVGPGDEIFYQVRGELDFHYMTPEGERKVMAVSEGELFLLPVGVPHSPRRQDESLWTLVVERRRRPTDTEYWIWFCERCNNKLYETAPRVGVGPRNAPNVAIQGGNNVLRADERLRTCTKCGEVIQIPS